MPCSIYVDCLASLKGTTEAKMRMLSTLVCPRILITLVTTDLSLKRVENGVIISIP